MGIDAFGSSVVIALAAVLWFVYLIPTWLRRREYLATERNAVRLQQTLRIMAETAEVPDQVRAETSARSVAAHQRVMKKEQQLADAIARVQDAAASRAVARRLVETQPAFAAVVVTSGLAARRLRRSRALTSLVLLGALVVAGVGVGPLVASGSWVLLVSGVAVAVGAFMLLGQMAAVGRARLDLARGLRATGSVAQAEAADWAEDARVRTGWTPVPVPKPLYLSRPQVVQPLLADPAAELAAAAAAAQRAIRMAQAAPNVTPIRPAVADPAATPSRFARMGIVEETAPAVTDLDAVLRRRRAVG